MHSARRVANKPASRRTTTQTLISKSCVKCLQVQTRRHAVRSAETPTQRPCSQGINSFKSIVRNLAWGA